MTRDDIIRMAREAGFITGETHSTTGFRHPFVHPAVFASCLPELERFAALVSSAEREACADIIERNAIRCQAGGIVYEVLCSNLSAIRAMGNK